MSIRIIVATHKKYRMPEDELYLPVHAGRMGKDDLGYVGDDTGENISSQNGYYNECTAIYWAWKNLNADIIGVAHYRRHFTLKNMLEQILKGKWACVLTEDGAKQMMESNDIIVAKKRLYIFETNKSHYEHAHDPRETALLRQIIGERCPEYIPALDKVFERRWAHLFNMFIMKREKFEEFCEWLFDVLLEFGNRVDMTEYPPQERRAFISEFLLDTWLIQKKYPYKEVRVMYMEKQKWLNKIFWFFWRKFVTNKNVYEKA